MKIWELNYEFLGALVQGGYLKALPLHDPKDASSWSTYYTCETGMGVCCRVHGEWDGSKFVAPGARAAQSSDDRAFARERAVTESRVDPLDTIALGGPISAAVLGLDESVAVLTLEDLERLAKAPSGRTRSVVALALRRMRHPRGVPILRTLLADPDEYVRKQAAWALGQIGSPADVPFLTKLLDDPAERVRDFSAYALARLGDDAGVTRSIAAMNDPHRNPIRRGEAAVALGDAPGHVIQGMYGSGATNNWKDVPRSRPDELKARVRTAIEATQATHPPPELAERCAYALEKLKR